MLRGPFGACFHRRRDDEYGRAALREQRLHRLRCICTIRVRTRGHVDVTSYFAIVGVSTILLFCGLLLFFLPFACFPLPVTVHIHCWGGASLLSYSASSPLGHCSGCIFHLPTSGGPCRPSVTVRSLFSTPPVCSTALGVRSRFGSQSTSPCGRLATCHRSLGGGPRRRDTDTEWLRSSPQAVRPQAAPALPSPQFSLEFRHVGRVPAAQSQLRQWA